MTKYILTSDAMRPSAERLASAMNARMVTSACEIPSAHNPTVIRWGTSDLCHLPRDFDVVMNPAIKIKENSDKLRSLLKMAVAVTTPTIFRRTIPSGVKAVVRPMEHSRGSDFHLVTGPATVPSGHYAKEFISNTSEYRVWFVGDAYFSGKRAPMESQGQRATDPCRSLWGYSGFAGATENQVRFVGAAKRALGLDFGAADILWDRDNEEYLMLEINTAPALDHDRVLQFYATQLEALTNERSDQG